MKNILIKLLFFFYRKNYYKPLDRNEEEAILLKLASTSGLEHLPNLLEQYANTARNQYMYSDDKILKGTILAFTSFREQIIKSRPKKDKKLTREEDNVIMKQRTY